MRKQPGVSLHGTLCLQGGRKSLLSSLQACVIVEKRVPDVSRER